MAEAVRQAVAKRWRSLRGLLRLINGVDGGTRGWWLAGRAPDPRSNVPVCSISVTSGFASHVYGAGSRNGCTCRPRN